MSLEGTMYDLRRLRRRQLPLLDKMRRAGLQCLRSEVQQDGSLSRGDGVDEPVVLGFSYPAEYAQVHLHLVLPPMRNDLIFDPRTFYSFDRVMRDLRVHGMVQKNVVLVQTDGAKTTTAMKVTSLTNIEHR